MSSIPLCLGMTNLKMFIFVFLPLETLFLAEGDNFRYKHVHNGATGRTWVEVHVSHLGCSPLTLFLTAAGCDPVTRIAVIETGDRSPTGTVASTDIRLRESTAPMAGREPLQCTAAANVADDRHRIRGGEVRCV